MGSPAIRLSLLPLLLAVAMAPLELNLSERLSMDVGQDAIARSTGGRTRGGSFRRAPSAPRTRPRTPSGGGFTTPRRQTTPRYNPPPRRSTGGGPVFVPIPTQPRVRTGNPGIQSPSTPLGNRPVQSGSAANSFMMTLLVLLIGGGGVGLLLWFLLKSRGPASPLDEINNDTVTVSKVQVALVENAAGLQQDLTAIASQADTSTSEGLSNLLQESALLLLRHPESWTHVYSETQTVPNLDIAQKVFNQLSIDERKKLSVETLVNVGGRVTQKAVAEPSEDEGPAAYIVVTLLVGTAHDKPLFSEIRDAGTLEQVLNDLASMIPDYLCVLELIWSPQDERDSLTYDELLTEYSEMLQL